MEEMTRMILQILDNLNKQSYKMNIIFFLPNWEDANFLSVLKNSKFTIYDKILKKGQYVLNEKDINKTRIETHFESRFLILNSMKDKLNNKDINVIYKKGEDINKFIIKEVKEVK